MLMPIHDAAKTVSEALASTLAQSFVDFEVLVVNDRSTDDGPNLVAGYAKRDPRVRLISNSGQGLVDALNTGIAAASGEFVARLDGDDRSHPDRIAAQVAALQRCPGLGLTSCRVRAFPRAFVGGGMANYLKWQDSLLCEQHIAREIYVESPFVHSAVMLRRRLLVEYGGYKNGTFPEDYELWLRLREAGIRMGKINRVLVEWRQSDRSLSKTDPRYSREAFDRVRARYLARDRRLHRGRPLVIWGAGRKTRQRARHLLDAGHQLSAWIDIDPAKIGNVVWGVRVQSPKWLASQAPHRSSEWLSASSTSKHQTVGTAQVPPFVLSYVASHGAAAQISESLDSMGYRADSDYLMVG